MTAAEAELIELVDDLREAMSEHPDLMLHEDWVTINGQAIDIGAGGSGTPMSKAELAKSAYNGGGDKHHQDLAEDSEKRLAAGLGLPRTKDNSPFDLQVNGKIGVECKCFITNKNDKLTQKGDAIGRKVAQIKSAKLKKTFTVVVDRRGDLIEAPKYYIRAGYGSFHLGTMTEMKLPEMKAYIAKRGTGKFSL